MKNAAVAWPALLPVTACRVLILRGTRAFAELFGGFRFGRGDVIHDAFGPAVNMRPAIAVADAVLVRRNVYDVRLRRPRGSNPVVRLFVGDDDDAVELFPTTLIAELFKRTLQIGRRVRLRGYDGVAKCEAT